MDKTTIRSSAPARIPLLDVLRGLAILGTLAMNIGLFGHPEAGDYGRLTEAVQNLFLSGKFFAMLTLLFGVGLAVQYRNAVSHGRSWPGRQLWRALLLLVEGALHVVLLFSFDVLMGYAVTALLVVYLLNLSERTRSIVMWTALGLHLAVVGALLALMTLVFSIVIPYGRGRSPEAAEEARLYLEGSYAEQVISRASGFLDTRQEVITSFPMMVFLCLLGVRLYRAGAFADDEVGRALRTRMAVWGLGVGLPLNALFAALPAELALAGRTVFSVVLMLGYVGLTGLLLDRVRRIGPVAASLAAVGRTALSCYILQNLLASVVFYGWGFGLAAHAQHGDWLVAAWFVIAAVLVAGSRWWLSRFERGPMELLQDRLLRLVPEHRASPRRPVARG